MVNGRKELKFKTVHWTPNIDLLNSRCLYSAFHTNYRCDLLAKSFLKRMSSHFYTYGKFCTSHPWEVIITFLTLTICLFSMGSLNNNENNNLSNSCSFWSLKNKIDNNHCTIQEYESSDMIIVTVIRCLALLYIYHQFRNMYKLGSKYLVGISGLFTVFSSFIFSSSVINLFNGRLTEVNKAMPLFLLLTDLPKASLLARFALSSFSREEVRENIARGMAIIGPTLTLDTLVETLAISVGAMSGVGKIEELSLFSCMSIIVNYILFMTIFPSCLSLALELSFNRQDGQPVWQLSSLTKVLQLESEHAPNPVIQKVKLIMSVCLMSVHMASFWELNNEKVNNLPLNIEKNISGMVNENVNEAVTFESVLRKKFAICPEQLLLFGLICVLIVKYMFYDNKDETLIAVAENHQRMQLLQQHMKNSLSENRLNANIPTINCEKLSEQKLVDQNVEATVSHTQDSDTESVITDNKNLNSNSPKASHHNSKSLSPSFFIGDDSSSDFSEDAELFDKEVQTDETNFSNTKVTEQSLKSLALINEKRKPRDEKELLSLLATEDGEKELTDEEVLLLLDKKLIQAHRLEKILNDPIRGVKLRRINLAKLSNCKAALNNVPYLNYDYSLVLGACCENVIGYMPLPLGVAGPILVDDQKYFIPMATTEGCLVASTNRGCLALTASGGVRTSIVGDGMTRGPVVRFPSTVIAAQAMNWIQEETNFKLIKETFDSTSRFARLLKVHTRIAGRYLFIRFSAKTGDAMGMNMLSKGTELALLRFQEVFPDMEIISLSGNFCSDKKPSAVNWIEGRGKSVVCEAEIPGKIVNNILKTNVKALVEVNISKNLIGSAVAGSIGGFNAHAANIVTAVYIATGQDPAQNISSSNCMTLIESCGENDENLYISCTMPSLELGTIGGGTILAPQAACLDLLGVRGSCAEEPGRNAQQFARIVCSAVLAAELSLLSALAAGHLVKSHMKHNRSLVSINATPGAKRS